MSAPNPADLDAIPTRGDWPELPPQSDTGAQLSELILSVFRLNARLLEAAQRLAAEGGLTASWWQVLGGVLDQPRTVAEIGRQMGMTRQGVQRVADLLVARGLAAYRHNPAHRRAQLLACTEAGLWAIRRIAVVQIPWADHIAAQLGVSSMQTTLTTIESLVAILEADHGSPD